MANHRLIRARMLLDHYDCYTRLQSRIPELHIIDINLTKPEHFHGKIIFSRYLVLRGDKEDKEYFIKKCKEHRTASITVNKLTPITGIKIKSNYIRIQNKLPEVFYINCLYF